MTDRVSRTFQLSLQSITMKLIIILFTFFVIEFVQCVPLVDQILPASTEEADDSSVRLWKSKVLGKKMKTYRLPNNSIPLRYDLWLKTEVDKEIFNFSGRVKIHIKVLEPTQIITLHMRRIVITKVDFLDVSGSLITGNIAFDYDKHFEFLELTLPTQRNVNDELILDIAYTGVSKRDGLGFCHSSYRDFEDKQDVFYASTQFRMASLRYAMPCYDEPAIRAVIGLEIQHTRSYHAISNMPVVSRTDVDGTDHVTTKFQDTIAMPTYLLNFIIFNVDHVSNHMMNYGDFAVGFAGKVLRKFEELFGIDFPLAKMHDAAIDSDGAEAMENIELPKYLEMILLKQPTISESAIMGEITFEIANIYFGNIVASNWWSHVWLSEGLASLFEYCISSLIDPKMYSIKKMKPLAAYAFEINDTTPLNFHAEIPWTIRKKFYKTSYRKSSAMLLMIMEAMTKPTFMKGLKFFLTDMYLKAATPDDFHRNLQKAYDEDFPGNNVNLSAAMSSWEDQAGYPTIHVTKTNGGFLLNQTRLGGGSEVYSID